MSPTLRSLLATASFLAACAVAVPSAADQLIQIPTADIVPGVTGEYKHHFSGQDEGYATLFAPAGRAYEMMFRYYNDYSGSHRWEAGGQFQLLPDGLVTPGLAVGMWDVTNSSPKGRRAFLVLTKSLRPGDFALPDFLPPTHLSLGVGTGKFSGPLAGVRFNLPAHFDLVAEYDARRFNAGLWYTPIKPLTLKAELQNGEVFLGATLRARF